MPGREIGMNYFVYILLSRKDNNLYVGLTKNLQLRLKMHFEGRAESTKNRRPLVLIGYEIYFDKHDAAAREKYLKSSDGRKEIKIRFKRELARHSPGKFLFEAGELEGNEDS